MISTRASLSRLIVCSMVACLLSALPGPGPSVRARAAAPIGAQPAPPDVDAAAFRDQGHLAFVWAGALYVLDGTRVTLRRITPLGPTRKFLWSPSGHWLAYDMGGGAPVRVVGPFPGTPDLFGFYGSPYLPLTYAWNRR